MIRIVEVGPRDGLQSSSIKLSTESKIGLINALSLTGVSEIEAGSFVSLDRVPAMADSDEVFRGITRHDGVIYSALTPNIKGLERALEVNVDKVAVFLSASETFSRKNIGVSITDSFEKVRPVVETALHREKLVRGYVSMAFHDPDEGRISPLQVLRVAKELVLMGVNEVSIGDTIGQATEEEVAWLIQVLTDEIDVALLNLHFHDTYGRASQNVKVGIKHRVLSFDSSVKGVGGCPFAAGSPGNISTENLLSAIEEAGEHHTVYKDLLETAGTFLA